MIASCLARLANAAVAVFLAAAMALPAFGAGTPSDQSPAATDPSGMTDAETEATAELLLTINRDHSVIVVEHDMSFVRALGVKVTVLHEGSMLAEGTLDQVSADPRVVEVYLGR